MQHYSMKKTEWRQGAVCEDTFFYLFSICRGALKISILLSAYLFVDQLL